MIQRPSQEEIEKGLAEFKSNYKMLLRNITDCLEFDFKAIRSLLSILDDSEKDVISVKRAIRPHIVNLLYILMINEEELKDDEFWGEDDE